MLDAADKVSQKHFPIGIAIIDLLLLNSTVNSSPKIHAAIAALRDITREAWDIIDAGVEKSTALAKKEEQDY